MHHITLGSETDFDGWRKAARALVLNQVKSSEVIWSVRGHAAKPVEPSATPLEPARDTFKVPARFVALVQSVIASRQRALCPALSPAVAGADQTRSA
jgi:uracil-DNA glycosylase